MGGRHGLKTESIIVNPSENKVNGEIFRTSKFSVFDKIWNLFQKSTHFDPTITRNIGTLVYYCKVLFVKKGINVVFTLFLTKTQSLIV